MKRGLTSATRGQSPLCDGPAGEDREEAASEKGPRRSVEPRDFPVLKYRGLQDDLSRGPVSTLEYQKKLIRTLAAYKANIYSPYFEHTQQYASNPLAGSLAVGHSAAGVYVFSLPAKSKSPLSISVSFATTAPVVLFVGDSK